MFGLLLQDNGLGKMEQSQTREVESERGEEKKKGLQMSEGEKASSFERFAGSPFVNSSCFLKR